MKDHKKGVSPLIATVLLIAFAVTLGAVVMNWGQQFTEDTTTKVGDSSSLEIKCFNEVSMELVDVDDRDICYYATAQRLEFIIDNTGEVNLTGIKVRAIDDKKQIHNIEVKTLLEAHEYHAFNISLDPLLNFNSIDQVTILPMLLAPGSTTIYKICSDKELKIDYLEACP